MGIELPVCDTCGEEDGINVCGDLCICDPCAQGERKDARPPCPNCGMKVPHSYLFMIQDEPNRKVWDKRCPHCLYEWDERVEGKDARMWQSMGIQPRA